MNKLEEITILLVTHSRTTGFSQMLRDWLKGRVATLIYIDHPLYPTKELTSSLAIYKNDILQQSYQSRYIFSPGFLLYIKDLLITIYYIFKSRERFDLAIGVDNLNTLALLLLRKLKRINKVIYHTVDYTPNRFSNKILNKAYFLIDKYCCYHADMIWNSSGRMNTGRISHGMDKDRIVKTIITPDGSNFDPKNRLPITKINRKMVIFLGHLRERLGLDLLIDAFVDIIKIIPDSKLFIIGDGPLMDSLQQKVTRLNISHNVKFTGFIEDHHEVDYLIARGAIGMSIFEPVKDSYEYYSDAGKPKVYLAAGLPIIITRVPEIALEIEKEKAGIAINYNKQELVSAMTKMFRDDFFYRECRDNAIRLSKKYQWHNIFTEAFVQTLNYLK
ncbi:MAG: glycosyltransferase [Candidatus Gottesmanbacteria bacterium]